MLSFTCLLAVLLSPPHYCCSFYYSSTQAFVFVAGQKEMDFVPLPLNVEPVSANNQTHLKHFNISHN